MSVRELTGDQRRQLVDTQQVFDAWQLASYDDVTKPDFSVNT